MQRNVGVRRSVRAQDTGFETVFGTLSGVPEGWKTLHSRTGVLFAVLRKSVACARVLLLQERNRSESCVSIFPLFKNVTNSLVIKCMLFVKFIVVLLLQGLGKCRLQHKKLRTKMDSGRDMCARQLALCAMWSRIQE